VTSQSFHPAQAKPAAEPEPFDAHVVLLRWFVARRAAIVDRIEGVLNAQRKPAHYRQDVRLLDREIEDCFFTLPGIAHEHSALRRRLEAAHWASGFKPRVTPGEHNDLIDPAEMTSRAFHMWQLTRWPGRQGRVRCAHILFDLYLLRQLMLLAMRLWDGGTQHAGERLKAIQRVLDELNAGAPPGHPKFLRDARWLFPLAQSPTTDELWGYFGVTERIDATLPEADRLEIDSASVRMAGGHLRSQLRHVAAQKGVAIDERGVVLLTRRSNALDLATLIQWLVPLLEQYERAVQTGEDARRHGLASAILQGVSPDPELFLNRVDLLGPYSMIEHLFIARDSDGPAAYTPMGQRQVRLLRDYAARIGRVAAPLHEDCAHFRPAAGAYSPYGALYGFSSRLLEHMALKSLTPDSDTRFGVEDVFTDGGTDKLAWVSGWRNLPHVPRDVLKLFEYPQAFAEQMFERVEQALRRRLAGDEARAGRLVVLAEGEPADAWPGADLPAEYWVSSDRQLAAAGKAELNDEAQLVHSRLEGELLVSYQTSGGWIGITKDVLTAVLGAGRDARIGGLPREAAATLKLMCPELIAP
jgi:hypothetical protein